MDALQDHTISFTGLKDGEHFFQFSLGSDFFSATGEEEFEGGDVTADVVLDKSATLLVVDLHLHGPVSLRCNHCNAPLEFPVDGRQRQIYRLTGEQDFEDDELVSLDPNEHSINLTHYLYECLRLALPIRHIHPDGQCDPEVELVLNKLIIDKNPEPDPRWEVLKDLKNKKA